MSSTATEKTLLVLGPIFQMGPPDPRSLLPKWLWARPHRKKHR